MSVLRDIRARLDALENADLTAWPGKRTVQLALAIGAAAVAATGNDGWGWMLFIIALID